MSFDASDAVCEAACAVVATHEASSSRCEQRMFSSRSPGEKDLGGLFDGAGC